MNSPKTLPKYYSFPANTLISTPPQSCPRVKSGEGLGNAVVEGIWDHRNLCHIRCHQLMGRECRLTGKLCVIPDALGEIDGAPVHLRVQAPERMKSIDIPAAGANGQSRVEMPLEFLDFYAPEYRNAGIEALSRLAYLVHTLPPRERAEVLDQAFSLTRAELLSQNGSNLSIEEIMSKNIHSFLAQ